MNSKNDNITAMINDKTDEVIEGLSKLLFLDVKLG